MSDAIVEILTDNVEKRSINLREDEEKTIIVFNKGKNTIDYALEAFLKKGAKLHIYNVITSSINQKLEEEVTLMEENAECEVINVLLFDEKSVLDSNVVIHHLEKGTISDFSNYAIAKDEAILNLDNNATIKRGASKASAHQKTKGLTLNKLSKIKALPNLFIDEYDVIASHACSIGSINKEDLFYLMSRGLTSEESSKLIVMGFIAPVIDKISDKKLKEDIYNAFAAKLS